jgi:hypothetical protein
MITTDSDSLLAPYGIPSNSDTVDVCETWNGSDYVYQATTSGSSDNVPGFPDTVLTVAYGSGYVTGYDATTGVASGASPVGQTAFDFVKADAATRQASYDYPYYGVSSPNPSRLLRIQAYPLQAATAADSEPFGRHGLTRKGVRALVDSAEEISPSTQGYWRFRSIRGDRTVILSIDPNTQLLVGEDDETPDGTAHIVHTWSQVPNGFVREHSEIESVERINGRLVKNLSRIDFQKVRINDPAFIRALGP